MIKHLSVLPIIVLLLGGLLSAFFGKNRTIRIIVSSISILMSFVFVILLVKPVMLEGNIITYWMGDWIPENGWSAGISLEVDGLGLFFAIIGLIVILFSGIYLLKYISIKDETEKFYALFLILSGSFLGLIFTSDLFNMYVIMELIAFSAVGIVAFRSKSEGTLHSAFKYILISSLGSLLILMGISMLYMQFHSLNMAQIAAMLHNNYTAVTLFALAVLIGGFAVKSYLFPFHTSVLDAFRAVSAPVSMFLLCILNMTGIYGMIRIVFIVFTSMNLESMRLLFIIWGTITMIAGTILALLERDLKEFIFFHSISQVGYGFIGIGFSTVHGLAGGLYNIINQTLSISLLLLCVGSLYYSTGTTDLIRLSGIGKKMPQTALIFLVGALSISGIPPFNGFISKSIILEGALESGYNFIAIIIVITTIVTFISFINIFKSVFLGIYPYEFENIEEVPLIMKISMCVMSLLCVVTGVIPQYIVKYLVTPAVSGILNVGKYIDSAMGTGFAEKWYGEYHSTIQVSYKLPEYLTIVPSICLIILVVFILAAAVGAMKPNIFLQFDNQGNNTATYINGEKNQASINIIKLLYKIKFHSLKYLSLIKKINTGIVNDYALWIISTTAIILVYLLIFI